MNFLKKLLKIILLYVLFGILISCIVSVCGGYQNLLIEQTMGNMNLFEYICILAYIVLLWCPMMLFMMFSNINFLNSLYLKISAILIIIVFFILCIRILSKKKNK